LPSRVADEIEAGLEKGPEAGPETGSEAICIITEYHMNSM
jgi:hypothetical protein